MRIASAGVYNAVMLFMLKEGDAAFRRCLGLPAAPGGSGTAAGPGHKDITTEDISKSSRQARVEAGLAYCCPRLMLRSPPNPVLAPPPLPSFPHRWRKVGPLVQSYLGNSLHALSAMTDPPLIAYTLRRLRASVPFMTPQPLRKFGDKLLRVRAGVGRGAITGVRASVGAWTHLRASPCACHCAGVPAAVGQQ